MPTNDPDIPAVDPTGTEDGVLPTRHVTFEEVLAESGGGTVVDPIVRANLEAFVTMHNSAADSGEFLDAVRIWLAAEKRSTEGDPS